MTDWLTPDDPDLATIWPGSLDVTPDELTPLLTAARDQCQAFAPALAAGDPVPDRWRLAQALQARTILQAGVTQPNGTDLQGPGFAVTVWPMDWTVKNLLRPRPGVPVLA